jgi:hypothetical protein
MDRVTLRLDLSLEDVASRLHDMDRWSCSAEEEEWERFTVFPARLDMEDPSSSAGFGTALRDLRRVVMVADGHWARDDSENVPAQKRSERGTVWEPMVRIILARRDYGTEVTMELLEESARPWLDVAIAKLEEDAQGAKRKQPRGAHGDTLSRVKEVRDLMESGGIKKTAACKRVGIDPRTYDKYVWDLVDWKAEDDE